MKAGFETILWGIKLDDIDRILGLISQAGYEGVEFAQRPNLLGIKHVEELYALLDKHHLKLLSIVGGTVPERLAFLETHRPEYLHISQRDLDHLPLLISQGIVPAIHPGAFSPIRRLSDVEQLLRAYSPLKIILDTAHMKIVGEDPVASLKRLKDVVIAVHLKDWTPEFGRFGYRYGRGFTELGRGTVDIDGVLNELQAQNYAGWLVVELDRSVSDRQASVLVASRWLAEKKIIRDPVAPVTAEAGIDTVVPPCSTLRPSISLPLRTFERLVSGSIGGISEFYEAVMDSLNDLVPCKLMTLWTCSPSQNEIALIAHRGPISESAVGTVCKPNELLAGLVLDMQERVVHFDLSDPRPAERYGYPERQLRFRDPVEKLGCTHLITLPIYNPNNVNYVRWIVNMYPPDQPVMVSDDDLFALGTLISHAADAMIDRLCYAASVSVNLIAGRSRNARQFLEHIRNLIKTKLACEGVAIFLVDEKGDRLEVAETTGTDWLGPEGQRYYTKGEGLTGRVWERNEPLLSVHSPHEPGFTGKSTETVEHKNEHACIWIPLLSPRGKVVGVIRCRNKQRARTSVSPNMFTDDDAAVLDAIGQAAAPHMHVLLEDEQRRRSLGRLTHELKVPVVAIRGAAESMTFFTKGSQDVFDYDYPRDIWSWSELMRRLLGNADILRYSSEQIELQQNRLLLLADVIAPARKQVEILLRERKFSSRNIRHKGFEQIPHLWVDQNRFQQVVFNLLSNSIKYSYDDPTAFQIEIEGGRSGADYMIWFRDLGLGIDPTLREMIFEEGFRSPTALERNVTGQGLGLWVVRQILAAHGASISLTSPRFPTEFAIWLPRSLASPPLARNTERK